jgi:NADP-dependent 3-hydroxy acid dehydrogenase YdfG
LDVTDVASIETFMKACIDHYGRVDVLVNNAGYNKLAKIIDYTEEQRSDRHCCAGIGVSP